jgi:RNA-directed DNA polymerase
VDELKAPGKPFDISKRAVWEAWEKVKANKGAPGVDAVTVAELESDLKNNLYKIWNRLSSGTYFPPPVRAVEIPKSHGGGTRILGVPSVGDRVAQTVVAEAIQAGAEPVFHPDSYGYRPGRSALDAVAVCRRCWEAGWVIDLDIRKFFDTVRSRPLQCGLFPEARGRDDRSWPGVRRSLRASRRRSLSPVQSPDYRPT